MMAIEQIDYKKCTKCGEKYPATLEFFHRNRNTQLGLHYQCKICVNTRNRKRAKEIYKQPTPHISRGDVEVKGPHATQINILGIKYRYQEGQDILVKRAKEFSSDPAIKNWTEGRVTGVYEHFMNVKLRNYTLPVLYKDILIGNVRVKVI